MAVFDFLAGIIPPGEHLAEFDTYTPTLTAITTNPNLGADGSATGWWHRIGRRLVVGEARFLFAGSGVSAGSGIYIASLPLPADTTVLLTGGTGLGLGSVIGVGGTRDASALTASRGITAQLRTGGSSVIMIRTDTGSVVADNSPFVWADGDRINLQFKYVISPGV